MTDEAGLAPSDSQAQRDLRVLVVEDSEIDYEFLLIMLRKHGFQVHARRVETASGMLAALADEHWDIVVSDHNLPDFSSMGALETLRSTALDLPFIIVSGEIGEDVAVAAMRAGVDDYLLKDRLARLGPAIEAAIERGAARRARRYAEDELRISEARLAALTSHLETLKERERSQVARDLHDEIGNALATVHFEVAGLVRRNNRDTESTKSLTTIRETVDRAVATMQRMMLNLRPSILDAGLVAALEWLVRECGRRADVKVSFTSNREDIDVAAEVSTAAFRICQEALNNALRHANATELQVELFSDAQNFTLEVRDNGQGFTKEEMKKDGAFGILGMQARARSLGGWIETSSSAQGTSIMLSLPLRTVLRGSVTP